MKWPIRFLSGDVELCVYGRDVERFFALCASNGISIERIKMVGQDEYLCHMTKRDVWDSRPYYRKAGVHCRIIKKRGMPFLMFRYRKRILFPLALCAVMYLLGYCSQYIWKIEINGNSYLTDERIISYLEENNASYGTKKSKIDCSAIELMLREDFDEVIWASVAMEGTNLVIELQEKTTPEEMVAETIYVTSNVDNTSDSDNWNDNFYDTEDAAGNNDIIYSSEGAAGEYAIIADKDATIVSIITRNGLAEVAAGDSVSAGDVLVKGVQEVLSDYGDTKFWYVAIPDADIIGEVVYEYSDTISVNAVSKSYGDAVLSAIYFQLPYGRLEIVLPDFTNLISVNDTTESIDDTAGTESPYVIDDTDGKRDVLESYYQAHLTDNFYLPFGIGLKWSFTVEESTYQRTDEEALSTAEVNLGKFLKSLEEDGVVILSKTVTMHKEGNEYVVEGEITVEESIGVIAPDEESKED